MQLKITNNGKQHYSKICLEKSVHYSSEYLGNWGILVIVIPTAILFTYGLNHFEKLEKEDFDRFQKREDELRQAS